MVETHAWGAGTLEKGSGLAVSDEGTAVEAHDCEFVSAGASLHACAAIISRKFKILKILNFIRWVCS